MLPATRPDWTTSRSRPVQTPRRPSPRRQEPLPRPRRSPSQTPLQEWRSSTPPTEQLPRRVRHRIAERSPSRPARRFRPSRSHRDIPTARSLRPPTSSIFRQPQRPASRPRPGHILQSNPSPSPTPRREHRSTTLPTEPPPQSTPPCTAVRSQYRPRKPSRRSLWRRVISVAPFRRPPTPSIYLRQPSRSRSVQQRLLSPLASKARRTSRLRRRTDSTALLHSVVAAYRAEPLAPSIQQR